MNQAKHEFMKNVLAGIGAFAIVITLVMVVAGVFNGSSEDQAGLAIGTKTPPKTGPIVDSASVGSVNGGGFITKNINYFSNSSESSAEEKVTIYITEATRPVNGLAVFSFKSSYSNYGWKTLLPTPSNLRDDGINKGFINKAGFYLNNATPFSTKIKIVQDPKNSATGYNTKIVCKKNGIDVANESKVPLEVIVSVKSPDVLDCTFTNTLKTVIKTVPGESTKSLPYQKTITP